MKFLLKVLLLGLGVHGMECSAQTVSGNISGYDFVDLGLPNGVKWATYNVGATKPEEYGNHFAWGETEPKEEYYWETYKWYDSDSRTITKYCYSSSDGNVDYRQTLEDADDAASKNWGADWRMPNKGDIDELIKGCEWEWTNDFNGTGVAGQIGTSKTNGNVIFLPATGNYSGVLSGAGSYGYYWSRSLNTSNSKNAYYLTITTKHIDWNNDFRHHGRSVRAISKAEPTGVPTINDQALKVYAENGTIHINNAQANSFIQVSDLNGRVVTSVATDCHGNSDIKLPDSKGTFVITVGGQSTKVILK